jgi:hypothetical protein
MPTNLEDFQMPKQTDIRLPAGWTWERVAEQRAKWGIADNMVPIATVPGACVAWGTIASALKEQDEAYARDNRAFCNVEG